MKRKIYRTNIIKIEDTLLCHAVLESIPKKIEDEFFASYSSKKDKERNLEIQFIVNGFPFDVKNFFDEFERQTDRMIKDEAEKLIKEKLGDLLNIIYDTGAEVEKQIKCIATKKLGITFSEWD